MRMEEYIEHYGVKGQRWGVRKKKTSGTGRKKRSAKQNEQDIERRIENGEDFIKQIVPAVSGATVSVVLASSGVGMVAPIASAAVSTSVRALMTKRSISDKDDRK